MKKRTTFFNIGLLVSAVLISFSVTGCFLFSQESITSCTAVGGDTMAVVSWKTSTYSLEPSTIYLLISPTPSDGNAKIEMTSGAISYLVENLSNGTRYTFTAINYDDKGDEYSSKSATATPSAGNGITYTYDTSKPYVGVDDDTSFVTLQKVSGKTIVFANINTTDTAVAAADCRTLVKAKARSVIADDFTSLADTVVLDAAHAERSRAALEAQNQSGIKHFVPPLQFDSAKQPVVAARAARYDFGDDEDNFDFDNPTIGESYRSIYVDNSSDMTSYAKTKVTLRAVGTYNNETVCLLWVDDNCFTTGTAKNGVINASVAKNLASTFAAHYEHERYVFGNESDKLVTGYSSTTKKYTTEDMSTNSTTKKVVNIVVYDIGTSDNGIVGYFYAKDYWADKDASGNAISYGDVRDYSNVGKYFYVDAKFCNLSGIGMDSSGNATYLYNGNSGEPSDTVVSTLVHEFQHMIDYNQKEMLNGLMSANNNAVPTWYNEMLSMLAEDMMQKELGTSDSEAPRGARLPTFNGYYYASGITDYLDGDNAVLSYSTAYAFGAWVARTFGGPELVSMMSQNSSAGIDSVLAAIKEKTGESYTIDQLMKKYVQACVYRSSYAYAHNLPTFKVDAGTTITAFNQTSEMTAIDLFSSDYKYAITDSDGNKAYYVGPLLANYTAQAEVRPHGFVLYGVGTASNDTVTLAFTPSTSSSNQLVIYVQDKFSNSAN